MARAANLFLVLFFLILIPACTSDDSPDFTDTGADAEGPVRTAPSLESVQRDEIWTWVVVEGTRCGQNEEATGLVVNKVREAPQGLVIFLTGGGACWDQLTCESGILAGYLDGFDMLDWADIESAASNAGHFGYFDREAPANPFRNYDMVFVPYCTGDVHTGDNVVAYDDGGEMHHVGYRNYGLFLEQIVRAFHDPDHVILAGGSAGGFGSIWNYERTQSAFGSIPVHMFSDSGIPFDPEVLTDRLQQKWRDAFRMDRTVPLGCGEACADARLDSVFMYNVQAYEDRRFALDSSVADEVVRTILAFGFEGPFPPMISEELFASGLATLAERTRDIANAHVFYVDGTLERIDWFDWVNYRTWHVFWKTQPGNPHVQVSGVPDANLALWLDGFIHGSETWGDAIPENME